MVLEGENLYTVTLVKLEKLKYYIKLRDGLFV